MLYSPLETGSTCRIAACVDHNWVHSPETNFLKKHVLARGAYLVLAPTSFIACALETIVGIGIGFGFLLCRGKPRHVVDIMNHWLGGSRKLALSPYLNVLRTINPEARLATSILDGIPAIGRTGDGLLPNLVIDPLRTAARNHFQSNNFLRRHVISRVTFGLLAVSCLITRAIDGIIGVPVAILSILTVGKILSLNNLAYRTLQAPCLIQDLANCVLGLINPQFFRPEKENSANHVGVSQPQFPKPEKPDEKDPFSAATLLADRARRRSDPTIYENAIKILGISDEVTLEHADQRHQFLVTELQRKLSLASKPLAACFRAQMADINSAYETVRANIPAST